MLNRLELIGRLGADPEMRETANKNHKYARFPLPLFQGFKQTDKKPSWIQCEAWNKLGDIVMTQKKGNLVYVEGELVIDNWEAKNEKTGEMEKRSRTYLRLNTIRFLDSKSSAASSTQTTTTPQSEPAPTAASIPDETLNEEDVPNIDALFGEDITFGN